MQVQYYLLSIKQQKQWYIYKSGDNCKHHLGYYRLDPNQVKTRSAVVPNEEI